MKHNMNRLYSRLNKYEITAVNPKTGETNKVSNVALVNKIKSGIKESFKKGALIGALVASIGVGGLAVNNAENIVHFKNNISYQNAVSYVAAEEREAGLDVEGSIDALVDEQEYCAKSYGGEQLLFCFDGPILKSCYDDDCRTCSNNRHTQREILEKMKEHEEFKDIVDQQEFYVEHGRGASL